MSSINDNSELSPSELREKIKTLQLHVQQLRNIIANGQDNNKDFKKKSKKTKKIPRKFDFNAFKKRHVLFHVAYFGWKYNGFTVQEDTPNTIENALFYALTNTKLIESRESSNYHRCGRTDKGVSAYNQVISIDVRSNLTKGDGVFAQPEYKESVQNNSELKKELNYANMLNKNLPKDIRIIAWSPLSNTEFSARFDCKSRRYKYFFPRGSVVNLDDINEAGKKLEGSHDFRNLCKMDINNGVTAFIRRMIEIKASVVSYEVDGQESPYDMCVLDVFGNAFLWHQIRCIVTILLRIGSGLEKPSLIDELLDIEMNPCRPQYGLASEFPLNLFDVTFESISWIHDEEDLRNTAKVFQEQWVEQSVKSTMIREALRDVESKITTTILYQSDSLVPSYSLFPYTPIMNMLKCPSFDEKFERANKRRKLQVPEKKMTHSNL